MKAIFSLLILSGAMLLFFGCSEVAEPEVKKTITSWCAAEDDAGDITLKTVATISSSDAAGESSSSEAYDCSNKVTAAEYADDKHSDHCKECE